LTTAQNFHTGNFHLLCDELGHKDEQLGTIIKTYGYPPLWNRPQGFATLIHIILEQQVSLASAKAAFIKLQEKITEITPGKLLLLTDEEMKACYFSRQKMKYARHLAEAIVSHTLNLEGISSQPDDMIRQELKKIKGIGDWTADIYLLFALQRTDIFPVGDLAMVNALKEIKRLDSGISKEEMIVLSKIWSPHRSIATMLLWHYYLRKKRLTV
jgi:DNA-3-methyladenine glycosylase II